MTPDEQIESITSAQSPPSSPNSSNTTFTKMPKSQPSAHTRTPYGTTTTSTFATSHLTENTEIIIIVAGAVAVVILVAGITAIIVNRCRGVPPGKSHDQIPNKKPGAGSSMDEACTGYGSEGPNGPSDIEMSEVKPTPETTSKVTRFSKLSHDSYTDIDESSILADCCVDEQQQDHTGTWQHTITRLPNRHYENAPREATLPSPQRTNGRLNLNKREKNAPELHPGNQSTDNHSRLNILSETEYPSETEDPAGKAISHGNASGIKNCHSKASVYHNLEGDATVDVPSKTGQENNRMKEDPIADESMRQPTGIYHILQKEQSDEAQQQITGDYHVLEEDPGISSHQHKTPTKFRVSEEKEAEEGLRRRNIPRGSYYYNVVEVSETQPAKTSEEADDYNCLDFDGKSYTESEDDGCHVYSHLNESDDDTYTEMNRNRKTEVIDDNYSHVYIQT